MPLPEKVDVEREIAQLAAGRSSDVRPRTLMEDFATLEKAVSLLDTQIKEFKRRVQNLVGTP